MASKQRPIVNFENCTISINGNDTMTIEEIYDSMKNVIKYNDLEVFLKGRDPQDILDCLNREDIIQYLLDNPA